MLTISIQVILMMSRMGTTIFSNSILVAYRVIILQKDTKSILKQGIYTIL
jgi:hypothetical protein